MGIGFVIMSNHVHGILATVEHPYPNAVDPVGAASVGAKNFSPLLSPAGNLRLGHRLPGGGAVDQRTSTMSAAKREPHGFA